MSQELGVQVSVAAGGRAALAETLRPDVHMVVAVACEQELRAGIRASTKPVLAVTNIRPNGPCVDTDVDLQEIRRAILQLINGK